MAELSIRPPPAIKINAARNLMQDRPLFCFCLLSDELLLERFAFDHEIDLLTDYKAAFVERLIPRHPELAAVDLAAERKGQVFIAPRVGRGLTAFGLEIHFLRYATDRDFSFKFSGFKIHARCFEGDVGMVFDIKKIARTQVLVAIRFVRIDRIRIDHRFDVGQNAGLLIEIARSTEFIESSVHR